ncbi:MAG: alpha/beta hydrolase [Phycisphaerales bacterium]|nr:alpha/beta hydrolase [Phycisphaerales bacterium]
MNVLGLILLLGIGLVIGWGMLSVHTYLMLTRPPRRTYGWAVARSLPGDPSELRLPDPHARHEVAWSEWTFRAGTLTGEGDGGLELPVWDIAGLDPSGPTVILTHGWSDSRVVMLGSGRVAAALPVVSRLIVWDLPGHGEARGRCSLGLTESGALRALVERIAERDRRVVLWGFSLGARISIEAASSNRAVEGLIAEAPYVLPRTPALNVLRHRGLPYRANLGPALAAVGVRRGAGPGLAGGGGRVRLDASRLDCRLLVIHGRADLVSPIEDGRRLAASARDGRIDEIEGGQHQSLWFSAETSAAATESLRRFLASR